MKNIFLTKDALLSKVTLRIKQIDLTEGFVYIREMSGYEKDQWEQSMLKVTPNGDPNAAPKMNYNLTDFRAKLAAVSICDESGNLLFEMSDAPALNKAMRAADLEKIVDEANKMNGISEKDKEEMLKNSEADQSGNSTFSSAEN